MKKFKLLVPIMTAAIITGPVLTAVSCKETNTNKLGLYVDDVLWMNIDVDPNETWSTVKTRLPNPTRGHDFFECWTKTDGTLVDSEKVGQTSRLNAIFIASCHIKYVFDQQDYKSGEAETYVKQNTIFKDASRPLLQKDNFTFTGWCTNPLFPTLTKFDDTETISNIKELVLYPVFEQTGKIIDLVLSNTKLNLWDTTNPFYIKASVSGIEDQRFNFEIWDDETQTFADKNKWFKVRHSHGNICFVENLSEEPIPITEKIIIRVTSEAYEQIGVKLQQDISLNVDTNYVNSDDYWIEMTEQGKTYSFKLDKSTLFSTNPLEPIRYFETEKNEKLNLYNEISRNIFDWDSKNTAIILGDNITQIGDNFLNNITSNLFQCKLIFTSTDGSKSKLTKIGNNFLNGSENFDGILWGTSNTVIDSIGDNFLKGCKRFKNSFDESLMTLELPQTLTSIGNNFMNGCSEFNSSVYFGNHIKTIGENFLANAIALNSPIGFPNTITSIGKGLFYNCKALEANISFAEGVTDKIIQDPTTFGCETSTNGVHIVATDTEFSALTTRFPESTSNPFRKLVKSESEIPTPEYTKDISVLLDVPNVQVPAATTALFRSLTTPTDKNFKFSAVVTEQMYSKRSEYINGYVFFAGTNFIADRTTVNFPLSYNSYEISVTTQTGNVRRLKNGINYNIIQSIPLIKEDFESVVGITPKMVLIHIYDSNMINVGDTINVNFTTCADTIVIKKGEILVNSLTCGVGPYAWYR